METNTNQLYNIKVTYLSGGELCDYEEETDLIETKTSFNITKANLVRIEEFTLVYKLLDKSAQYCVEDWSPEREAVVMKKLKNFDWYPGHSHGLPGMMNPSMLLLKDDGTTQEHYIGGYFGYFEKNQEFEVVMHTPTEEEKVNLQDSVYAKLGLVKVDSHNYRIVD
jgi:hypothetical protein